MSNGKPLYPLPWWNSYCKPEAPDEMDFGDEFTVQFIGMDCDGNALFKVKRKKCIPQPKPPRSCMEPCRFR